MKVLGFGLSRTGTMSLRHALDQLGFPCYHVEVAGRNFERGDLDLWIEYMEGRSEMDWQAVFDGYQATTDVPAALFYEELLQEYPDAKVILTVRDPEKWYASLSKLMDLHDTKVEKLQFIPRFKAFQRVYRHVEKQFKVHGNDKAALIKFFNEHNETVKAMVAEDRLLVYEVKKGYQPLCDFLGVPVPDNDFPNMNTGIKLADKLMKQMLQADLIRMFGPWLLAVAAIIILLAVWLFV